MAYTGSTGATATVVHPGGVQGTPSGQSAPTQNPITAALQKQGAPAGQDGWYNPQQITAALTSAGYPQGGSDANPNSNAGNPTGYANLGQHFGVPTTPAANDQLFANMAAIQSPKQRAQAAQMAGTVQYGAPYGVLNAANMGGQYGGGNALLQALGTGTVGG